MTIDQLNKLPNYFDTTFDKGIDAIIISIELETQKKIK